MAPRRALFCLLPAALCLLCCTGCLHQLIATGIYLWDGGNIVPAECEALEEKKVVVFCRPPASNEFSSPGAARMIAKTVSRLLEMNVKKIEIVDQKEVDNWTDENDSDDFKELGQAVSADMVVNIELASYDLYKGKTLYQGAADVTVEVYDMQDHARLVWTREMGEVLFPLHSGVPAQDKAPQEFERQYVAVLSEQVAKHFYKHDPNAAFAIDATANR